MPERPRNVILLFSLIISIFISLAGAQDIVVSKIEKLDLSGDDIIEVEADTGRGFNFPYFLFIPKSIDKNQKTYILVEPNNTGTASDDREFHRQKALKTITSSYPNQMARELNVPLLVPTFPRPKTNWQAYTHSLDRDTLEINDGELKRIDLQMAAMIDHAAELLRANGFETHDKVFMHGFSASAKFCMRFAFLHPQRVKAVAAGGVNGLPTLPVTERNGYKLPFPIGIADIETFTGSPYDEEAVRLIPQYIYMGYMDRNDTLPSRDAWRENEAELIRNAIAETMMPDRWQICRDIYKEKLPRAQCVTYNGVAHAIKSEMQDDIVKFFKANSGDTCVAIEPHEYPFVEYRQLRQAHINAVYFKGDSRLPEFVGKHLKDGTCLLGIDEWLDGQDYRQLDDFYKNAGFNFRLSAEGYPDIFITENNYGGNSSMGNGEYQAYYLRLDEEQKKALVPNVAYTLIPENKSDEYTWTVNEGVTFILPIPYDVIVIKKLDSYVPPRIVVDMTIKSAVDLLNQLARDIELEGRAKQIRFVLKAEPEDIYRVPKIKFSAEGLSLKELLLIICNRASMDYRIEGTTIYLEKKN